MNISLLLPVMLLLGACSAHELRCDRHLQPINTPAPAIAAGHAAALPRSLP